MAIQIDTEEPEAVLCDSTAASASTVAASRKLAM
jgi:hypothetical protein